MRYYLYIMGAALQLAPYAMNASGTEASNMLACVSIVGGVLVIGVGVIAHNLERIADALSSR